MQFDVFVTGRKRGGAPFELRTTAQAGSKDQAREAVERDYDFEDALTLNFEIHVQDDSK